MVRTKQRRESLHRPQNASPRGRNGPPGNTRDAKEKQDSKETKPSPAIAKR